MRHLIAPIGLLALVSCSGPTSSKPSDYVDQSDWPANEVAAVPPVRVPNYDEHEGDRYLYVSAVSEEDQKKGKAVGDVVQYRFVGDRDGMATLERVTESGIVIAHLQCQNPCRIMKFTSGSVVDRIPYNTQSVAGAAMEDALNGALEPVKAPPKPKVVSRIPAKFLGTWVSDMSACGTALDDSMVSIEPGSVNFYASKATPRTISIVDADTMKLDADFEGEGEVWRKTFTVALVGGKLTVDDDANRSRCAN